MQITARIALVGLMVAAPAIWAQEVAAPNWSTLQFLIGDWMGAGGGKSEGAASGWFSFHPDLQQHVLVRKNVADYPAQNGRAAAHHEDWMIIYPGPSGRPAQAIYFDSEGHVIRYPTVEVADGRSVRLVSETVAGEPRYRLSYRLSGPNMLEGRFEIAPAGKPDDFQTYLRWSAERKSSSASR